HRLPCSFPTRRSSDLVAEKLSVSSIIRPVAADYCIPLTIGRGYSSLPPRHAMAERYRKSGKDKLVLIVASDFDPEGEDIPHSFADRKSTRLNSSHQII